MPGSQSIAACSAPSPECRSTPSSPEHSTTSAAARSRRPRTAPSPTKPDDSKPARTCPPDIEELVAAGVVRGHCCDHQGQESTCPFSAFTTVTDTGICAPITMGMSAAGLAPVLALTPKPAPLNRLIGLEELAQHNTVEDCWIAAHGKVYDVTHFVKLHPGGAASILKRAGREDDAGFDFHGKAARELWDRYYIGKLDKPSRCLLM